MGLRRELLLSLSVLVGFTLLLTFGAMGLLARMGPAIQRILMDNTRTIVTTEEMLTVLSDCGDPITPRESERLQQHLQVLRSNITEPGEASLVDQIQTALPVAGQSPDRPALIAALLQLSRLNWQAMRQADDEAQRLAWAGSWAAAVAGLLVFLASLGVFARLRRRLLTPLEEIQRTLDAARRGQVMRRCHLSLSPPELQEVMDAVNSLLDEHQRARALPERAPSDQVIVGAVELLLERCDTPAALVDDHGKLLRANSAMLDALSEQDGDRLRRALVGHREDADGNADGEGAGSQPPASLDAEAEAEARAVRAMADRLTRLPLPDAPGTLYLLPGR